MLDAPCGISYSYLTDALTGQAIGFTETATDAGFLAQLTGGMAWDVVIIDSYDTTLSAATNQAIRDFIAAGGVIWGGSNNWESATAQAFGAALGAAYDEPQEIELWDRSHPLFAGPHDVPDLVPTIGTCGSASEGYHLTSLAGAHAVAGYVGRQHAIVVGHNGRTVLFGGVLGLFAGNFDLDGTVDGLEMAEDALHYLLAGPVSIDGFESGSLDAWN